METNDIAIEILKGDVLPSQHAELFRLYAQLTDRALDPQGIEGRINEIVASPNQQQFIALKAGQIVGAATFTLKPIPTERTGYIDDVVVDRSVRGQRVGRALLEPIISVADQHDLTLQLTSSDARESALALYKKLGFATKDTNYMVRHPS